MCAVAPSPYAAVNSATKIAGDFIGWGIREELKKYKTDVCMWRAGPVSTKLSGNPKPDLMTPTPEQYVEAALGKCTSGAHAGYFIHEIVHLFLSNIKEIFGIAPGMKVFNGIFATL